MSTSIRVVTCVALLATAALVSGANGQASSPQRGAAKSMPESTAYVIGAGDVLSISLHGQDPTLYSGDVVVRPDGKIWRYMIDEVQASGLTPRELRDALTTAYSKYFEEPTVLVDAKEFNSWTVGITGSVLRSGEYPLSERMNVVDLIMKAGGLQEFADKKNIRLIRRHADGRLENIPFNYEKLFEGSNPPDIPRLRPGDTVVVK